MESRLGESESALELEEVELRRMRDEADDSPWFGEDFLWAALFRRGTGA